MILLKYIFQQQKYDEDRTTISEDSLFTLIKVNKTNLLKIIKFFIKKFTKFISLLSK